MDHAYHKPHQGLKGATPAEMYFAKNPARSHAVRPHRAYENKPDQMLFEIAYLDPEHWLAVLTPKKPLPDGTLQDKHSTPPPVDVCVHYRKLTTKPITMIQRSRRSPLYAPTHAG